VVDLDSKNGTLVDGERVSRRGLPADSVIVVGGTVLWIGPPPVEVPDHGGQGHSEPWASVCRTLDRAAPTDTTVLLVGETGTGKEVAARRVHRLSGRRGTFRAVNCAAIPAEIAETLLFGHVAGAFTGAAGARDGHFVAADRGTLFLDELGELPKPVQAKLLRVVETGAVLPVGGMRERRVDVRIVAATCTDLTAAVSDGAFRQDLYARLAQVPVHMPRLSQRRLDVPMLARTFLAEAGCERPMTAAFVSALLDHGWPSNVRELRSVMRRVALLSDAPVLDVDALDLEGPRPGGTADPQTRLPALLSEHAGNVARVAEALGKDRKQVYRWLKKLGLKPEDYR
jgi:DNA-binding NtrC family response regulator